MQIIKSTETTRHKNSETCAAIEYTFKNENDINGAIIELEGRYPETGFVVNDVCKELIYIIDGVGSLTTGDTTVKLASRTMALIQPGEAYYFDGVFTMHTACSPAWYPAQHRNI